MKSKFFRWHSLRTRVTLFTLAIFVASIWAVSLYASRTMQDDMQRVLGEQQFATVSVVAANINAELDARLKALERIAVDIGPAMSGNPKALQALLEQRPVFQTLFNAGFYVTGLDGIVIANVPASTRRIGVNFLNDANSAYLAGALKGRPIVGTPFVGKVLKVPIVPMAVPIRDAQGKVIGALAGIVNLGLPNFLDRITQARYGRSGGYMLITQPQRLVVTATDRSRIMTVLPGPGVNLLFDRYMQGFEGSGRIVDSRGFEVLSAAKQIPVASWLLVARLPAEEAFLPIHEMQRRMLAAAILLTLLSGGLTWWMLVRQLAPMVTAAKTLAAMTQANRPPHTLSISRDDEVGELIGGFNRLLETLARREAALQKSESNLAITLNSIGDAVIATDSSGCITAMNPTAERLCGWPLADAMGHVLADVFRIINAATLEPVADPVQRVMAQGQVVGLANHTLLLARDGKEYQISDSAAPIRNAAGEIVGVVLVFSDVTEQYRAQEALRAGERRFRSYFDQPLVGIAITSPEKGWIEANEHLCEMLGYGNDELVRLTWAEFTHPDDLAADVMQFERVMRGDIDGYAIDKRFLRKDRSVISVFLSVRCVRKADGSVDYFVALLQDITGRKRIEAELQKSEERWKFAIEGSGDGLWDWNIRTDRAFYSPRYKQMFGYADADIGTTSDEWSKRIHPDDAPGVVAAIKPYMDGKPGSASVEFRMLCQDGSWMWTLGRGLVVERDADGKPLRMIGTTTDISRRKRAENALRQSEARYRTMFDSAPEGVWMIDPDRRTTEVNERMCDLVGYSREELLGRNPAELADEENGRIFEEKARIVPNRQTRTYEIALRHRDGHNIRTEFRATNLFNEDGSVMGVMAFVVDLTVRKQAEERLQLAASVFGHAREGIVITDAQGTIVDVNGAFTRITGYGREEAVGQNPSMLKSGRQDAAFYEVMWRDLKEQGHWSGEIWNRCKDGEVYAELLTISAVRDGAGAVQQYVGLFSDITAIKQHQSELEHIAHYDALTNLPNRVLLADRLQQAMAQAQRRGQQLAVVYLDLDGFKAINDRHGHEVGDQVLITLARRMKQALREGDSLARLGGDEFVAVLIDLDDMAASRPMLSRLLAACAQGVQVAERGLQVSASLGVTFYPQSQEIDADQLLRQADQAMYQAKMAGKNRYHLFDAEQDSSIRGRHESLERIRMALEDHEFVLHYQPKVNMRSGQIIGAEALIRWQHPEKGLLPPAMFLSVIEDHALTVDIGEWVIDTALTQMELWQAAGLDMRVSINVGARQLQQGDFVDRLKFILARHPSVKSSHLELEVLETSALEDIAQVSQVIEACAQIGVKFALDDFGTGYSSLTYLKRLRVAMLKIDQSFVRDMLEDPDDLAILEGIIGLAEAFRREVIAEGVETVEHGSALLQLGCELAQGYGIARPMPAGQMHQWAATWQPDAAWHRAWSSAQAAKGFNGIERRANVDERRINLA